MRFLLTLALALGLAACDTASTDAFGGKYTLTLYAGDEVAATGTMTVRVEPQDIYPARVSGTWRITRRVDRRDVTTSGTLAGTYDGRTVSLALEVPEVSDSGYRLDGIAEGREIRGEWGAGMIAGANGSFVAER